MTDEWGNSQTSVVMMLYTDSFVIRGNLTTRHRRLLDMLNLAEDEFLVLADAVLEPLGNRGTRHEAPHAQVNLAAVLFAVAHESVAPTPELRTPKVPETTLISIPPFSITGHIHLLPEREIEAALKELHGRFIPVTEATYWSTLLGEAPATAPMVAVNHARAQILSPYSAPGTTSRIAGD
ncbi:MAG: hypothetical protein ABI598_03860 [Chloroflexota bacterium]